MAYDYGWDTSDPDYYGPEYGYGGQVQMGTDAYLAAIDELYMKYLNRHGSPEELQNFSRVRLQDIAATMYNSLERRINQIKAIYQQGLGRDPTAEEIQKYQSYPLELLTRQIDQSDERKKYLAAQEAAKAPAASDGGGGGATGPKTDRERIDEMLRAVQSTDDPEYWYRIVAEHGGLDATGVEWVRDRINRGDGSILVRTGQLSRVTHGTGPDGLPGDETFPEFDYEPWTEEFDGPDWTGGDFVAPTAATEENDPGYGFRLSEGQKALRRQAAAQGIQNSAATTKGLERYAQDYASAEYDKVYTRSLQEYLQKYSQYNDEYTKALNEYRQRYGEYSDAYQKALQAYQEQYGASSDAYNRAWARYLNDQAAQQQAYSNAQNEQQTNWTRLFDLYTSGLSATGGANNASSASSARSSDLITGRGNSAAAAQASSGAAWSSALSNLSNNATLLSIYAGRRSPRA